MRSSNPVQATLQCAPKEFISKSPPRGFQAEFVLSRAYRHVTAVADQFKAMLLSKLADERFIRIRLRASQLVIEMNNGENDTDFLSQFEHKAEQRHRIRAARKRNANAVSRPDQILFPDVRKHILRELMHSSMVHPPSVWVGGSCPDNRMGKGALWVLENVCEELVSEFLSVLCGFSWRTLRLKALLGHRTSSIRRLLSVLCFSAISAVKSFTA